MRVICLYNDLQLHGIEYSDQIRIYYYMALNIPIKFE